MSIFSFLKRKPKYEFQYDPTAASDVIEEQQIVSMKSNDLDFADMSRTVFSTIPIELAKNVQVSSREIVEKSGKKFTFPLCPGIWDYARMGYVLRSWTDFHIKANKAGVAIVMGGAGRTAPFAQPYAMDADIGAGFFDYENVKPNAWNFNSPWRVFAKTKTISALLLPATYHSPKEILENLYIYPGIVDYGQFTAMNVICSVRKKCEFTIKAGDPLLHIIPILNERIVCGYGPPTLEQEALGKYDPNMHTSHFYRKKYQTKKDYTLEETENKQ